MCSEVNFLGVLVDHKLRFEQHVQTFVTKDEQRILIVRNFEYLSTTPPAIVLVKSVFYFPAQLLYQNT